MELGHISHRVLTAWDRALTRKHDQAVKGKRPWRKEDGEAHAQVRAALAARKWRTADLQLGSPV